MIGRCVHVRSAILDPFGSRRLVGYEVSITNDGKTIQAKKALHECTVER